MSIKKHIQRALLIVNIVSIGLIIAISLFSFSYIRSNLSQQMDNANKSITENNTGEMLSVSMQLAESTAHLNAEKINADFSRIKGELLTIKGDIENIYRSKGVHTLVTPVSRYEEYIVSEKADISAEEIEQTVDILSGITAMFDNVLFHEDKISLAYIVLENGMVFSSTKTFYPAVEKADMRTRDWYKNAIEAEGVHWAELYTGSDGRNYVTVAVPVYADNKVFGVTAFDLRVSEISDVVFAQSDATFTQAFVMTASGDVLLSTESIEDTFKLPVYQKLMENVDFSKNELGHYNDDQIISGYATINETGWKLVNLLDYNKVLEPVRKVETAVSTTSDTMQETLKQQIRSTITVFLVFLFVLLVAVLAFSAQISGKITKPIEVLALGVDEIGNGNLGHTIPDLGENEIGKLASNFNTMSKQLSEYITNLAKVTKDKERIATELNVATTIQRSMLPCIFPAFPDRREMDIYASMLPAKEVGGDFYDFFLIGQTHIGIVVADVSGKGVPAALFMVIAKTLIKNFAQLEISAGQILTMANEQLCQNNEAGMFVTVFLAIMDLQNGEMTYANAGHNAPLIKRVEGEYEWLKAKPGFVLAGMEGMVYKEHKNKLNAGDKLFLYTDGVTEATNAENELFSDPRLLEVANKYKDCDVETLLHNIKKEIDIFVANAPQFDDITMLGFEWKGVE